jgi:hypothetical protein
MLKANQHNAAMRVKLVCAKPMHESATDKLITAAVIGIRLSKRETSQPDMGSPTSELMGKKIRMVPNSASL